MEYCFTFYTKKLYYYANLKDLDEINRQETLINIELHFKTFIKIILAHDEIVRFV